MSFSFRRMAVVAVAASALAVAGCGSDDPSSTPASTSADATTAAAPGLEAAQAALTTAMEPPTPIELPALSKTPPTGKKVVYVTCPTESCSTVAKDLEESAKVLGWTVATVQGGITPESQVDGLRQAVQDKPDAIVMVTVVPGEVLAKPLGEAKAAGVPVVTIASSDLKPGAPGPGEAVIAAVGVGPQLDEHVGKTMANWVTVDSKGSGKVAFFNLPGQPSANAGHEAFAAELAKACEGCSLDTQTYSLADVGKKLPGQVVSYVQQHPDTEYVGIALGSTAVGVSAALKSAGLDTKVKLFSRNGSVANQQAIASGGEAMTIVEELQEAAWRANDAIARHALGDALDPCCVQPLAKSQLLTKENLGDPNEKWHAPKLRESFTETWQLDS